jgi:hypothetical protein
MRDALRRLASLLGVHTVDRERREQDLKDELAFHFNIEVERRMAAGQSPADALVSAKRDFGNVPLVEDVTRGMWGWSMQDYKLGVRMLVKFPGLTVAGGLALAIALGLGAGWYEFSRQLFHPEIPLPDGHRLVEFEAFNTRATQQELRLLHDFVTWRRDLRSVEELSAYRTIERPLTMAGVQTDPLLVAEMTASAFRVARVPALLGRTLIDEDERPGAPAVIVLGHRVWERWFGGTRRRHRTTRAAGTRTSDRGRRHARGLRLSGEPPGVVAAAAARGRVRTARGRRDHGVRPARSRSDPA